MAVRALFALFAFAAVASGHQRMLLDDNYNPATITVNSAPYSFVATPITPQLPYSQAAYQCKVSGDSRIPGGATFPLTLQVPAGQTVEVVFSNGYTTTQLSGGDGTSGRDAPGSAGGVVTAGRKLLQGDLVYGGPNNGLLEYVQYNSNSGAGLTVNNGQYGVTSLSFRAGGGSASFKGSLEVGQVNNGVPVVPFVQNKPLSPECQVNINFVSV